MEEVLMARGYPGVAKAYILYRQQRSDVRRLKGIIGVRDDLKLGINAIKVLERRYLLRDEDGNIIEPGFYVTAESEYAGGCPSGPARSEATH